MMKSNCIIIKKSPSPLANTRGPRVAIPGVYPSSSHFGEQVVKFRVPSLDAFIGGGVPVGSICLIIDEFPSKFGNMVLKSFIADGACHNHRIFIAGDKVLPTDLANDLPSVKKSSSEHEAPGGPDGDPDSSSLKIAWRYGQSNPHQSSGLKGGGGTASDSTLQAFDFSKKVSVLDLGGKQLYLCRSCFDTDLKSTPDIRGDKIIREIVEAVEGLSFDTSGVNSVARICISHLEDAVLSRKFLIRLKAIVRHTSSCAVIIVSDAASLGGSRDRKSVFARAEHLADIVISMQSVVDQKRRDDLGGIDGICSVKKVASNNSLKVYEPPKDVGISFKKKKLLFHELHLPPEGETTTQRETSKEKSLNLTKSCATSSKGVSLDF